MRRRNARHDAIRQIVRANRIRTQRELVERLREQGFDCTQATVSRDIAEMGLRKILPEGTYSLAEDLHLKRMVADLVIDVPITGNLVLVKTASGTAQGVAAALDAAELPGVLGSIAGDDTILVIGEDESQARAFKRAIDRLRPYGGDDAPVADDVPPSADESSADDAPEDSEEAPPQGQEDES